VREMAKSLIHLEDIKPKIFENTLKKSENCYVELEENIKNKLFQKAVELSPKKTLASLAEAIDVSKLKLAWYKKHPLGLSALKKMSEFLIRNGYENFSLNELEKHMKFIQSKGSKLKVVNPNFPFNFATSEGVRLISRLYHDGGITHDRRPFYSNNKKILIDEFCEDVRKVFGTVEIKYFKTTHGYMVILSRLIGDILEIVGCHRGDKVIQNPLPPIWIKDLDKSLIKEFLRVAMDDEGSVGKRMIVIKLAVEIENLLPENVRRKLRHMSIGERIKFLKEQINLELEKFIPSILSFDRELLGLLGIETSSPKLVCCYFNKRNKVRTAWEFYVTSRKNLEKFLNMIGFKLTYKNESLKRLVGDVKRRTMKKNNFLPFLLMVKNVQTKRGFVTNNLINSTYNLSKQYVERLKLECEKKNLVKEIGKEGPIVKYILTKIGEEIISKGQQTYNRDTCIY
jgi:hypothetical protein